MLLRNLAMQAADGVAEGRSLHGADGHREGFVAARRLRRARAPETNRSAIPAFAAVRLEIFAHHAGVEHGRCPAGTEVCVVKTLLARAACQRFFEAQTVIRHQNADSLDGQEGGVPFVHVIDGGAEPQLLERAQAADAQHDFLADALVIVAAIKLIGDLAMLGCGVLRDVAIEQVELHAAHVDAPDLQEHFDAG